MIQKTKLNSQLINLQLLTFKFNSINILKVTIEMRFVKAYPVQGW